MTSFFDLARRNGHNSYAIRGASRAFLGSTSASRLKGLDSFSRPFSERRRDPRGDVDSLMTLIEALVIAGIELIGEAAAGRA
jgi:hypothetical protein